MRRRMDVLDLMVIIMAVIITVSVIVGGVYLFSASKKLKSINITPDFAETELEVGSTYSFTVKATPKKASLKKLQCVADNSLCSFELGDDGKAVLNTGLGEGTVTLYVESKDIKSQVMTFNIVDSVARAQAEAEAVARAQEEERLAQEAAEKAAEEEANRIHYVKCTNDDVRVRAENNTDSNIIGKADTGDVFEKVEDVDGWTHIKYKHQDGFMKSDYLTEATEEEALEAQTDEEAEEEEEPEEEKKKDEKKEEKKQEAQEETRPAENETAVTQTKEEAEAKAKADAEAAAAAAQAQLDAAAAAQAAAAAVGGHEYQGHMFTQSEWNYFLSKWDYTGQAEEMISHHSVGDLIGLLDYDNPAGVIRSR